MGVEKEHYRGRSRIGVYPGQYYDGETGLHYNCWRYYDSNIGRYITHDPIGTYGELNLFVYVDNNPLSWIDSYGLFKGGTRSTRENTLYLGHSDFTCGQAEGFDYEIEDWGASGPDPTKRQIGTWRHFKDMPEIEQGINNALNQCTRYSFERYLHQGQDYFVHYRPGYRTFGNRKKFNIKYWFPGHSAVSDADDTRKEPAKSAWQDANRWTCDQVKKWKDKGCCEFNM